MPPLLIAKTAQTLQDCAVRCGDFEDWFVRGLGFAPSEVKVVHLPEGDRLPPHCAVRGIVITGSHAMVTERAPWSEDLAGWVAPAVPMGMPVLGVCYGHQLLAHAQSVLRLPEQAVHLVGNDYEPHHAFRIGERAWGVQFHLEFDTHIMHTYVQVRAARCEDPQRDWEAIRATVRYPTPRARRSAPSPCRRAGCPAGCVRCGGNRPDGRAGDWHCPPPRLRRAG